MEKKVTENKVISIISLIFLVVGLSFLVNSKANITGAVIGISTPSSTSSYFTGAFFILVSFILFAVSIGGLEEKIKVINRIGSVKCLKKLSEKARKNQQVNRDLTNMYTQLEKGYLQGGIGKHFLEDTKGIFELRSKGGARLYCRKIPEGYEALAESSKGTQQEVINALKRYYT